MQHRVHQRRPIYYCPATASLSKHEYQVTCGCRAYAPGITDKAGKASAERDSAAKLLTMSDLILKRLLSMADNEGVGQKMEQFVTRMSICTTVVHQLSR